MQLHLPWAAIGLSLCAFPLCYVLNSVLTLEHPWIIALIGAGVLVVLFALVYFLNRSQDPFFHVYMVFSFTSVIDAIIGLEEDGYISGFIKFYMREGEPHLTTAFGIMIGYWDGVVHYGLYLAMITAITQRKSYRNLGLYWIGSFSMTLVVYLLGNVIGKYGSELRPAYLLNVPYLLFPIWAAPRIFKQPKAAPLLTADKIFEEQNQSLFQRPLDLGLLGFLLFAVVFTLFRGLVVLDCPFDICFDYIFQHDPYLRDPVAYPRIQMLLYLFYCLPYFCLCIYGLLSPGCTWMPDWALVFAGAIAQAQFVHVGSAFHQRTPFPYRTPENAWWPFVLSNVAFAVGPHLMAFRCLRNPGFFAPPVSRDAEKKTQ